MGSMKRNVHVGPWGWKHVKTKHHQTSSKQTKK